MLGEAQFVCVLLWTVPLLLLSLLLLLCCC